MESLKEHLSCEAGIHLPRNMKDLTDKWRHRESKFTEQIEEAPEQSSVALHI